MYAHFIGKFYLFFIINPNIYLESGVHIFQALFFAYAMVINETPGLHGNPAGSPRAPGQKRQPNVATIGLQEQGSKTGDPKGVPRVLLSQNIHPE